MQNAPERMNDTGTCTPTRAESVQAGSLDVLARALVRARPHLPVHLRPLASLLSEQLKHYADNPAVLGPKILKTVDRMAGALNAEDRG